MKGLKWLFRNHGRSLKAKTFEGTSLDDLKNLWLGTEEENPEIRWIYIIICIGEFDCVGVCFARSCLFQAASACAQGAPRTSFRARVLTKLHYKTNMSYLICRTGPFGWPDERTDAGTHVFGQHRLGGTVAPLEGILIESYSSHQILTRGIFKLWKPLCSRDEGISAEPILTTDHRPVIYCFRQPDCVCKCAERPHELILLAGRCSYAAGHPGSRNMPIESQPVRVHPLSNLQANAAGIGQHAQ